MERVRLFLCAYRQAGLSVLEHVLSRTDIAEVALFTHDPEGGTPALGPVADRAGIFWTTESVSQAALPFSPDIVASVYYGKIISPKIIDTCDRRIFNVHPSLLPRHRGCSSVPWAIIEGDTRTGVTFHYIDEGIDTGPIIVQSVLEIRSDETQASLFERCMHRASEQWPDAFALVKEDFSGLPQVGESCYHRRGAPYGGAIADEWDLGTVERFIRAMTYPPYPYATYNGREVQTLDDYLALRSNDRRLTKGGTHLRHSDLHFSEDQILTDQKSLGHPSLSSSTLTASSGGYSTGQVAPSRTALSG